MLAKRPQIAGPRTWLAGLIRLRNRILILHLVAEEKVDFPHIEATQLQLNAGLKLQNVFKLELEYIQRPLRLVAQLV